MGRFLVDVAHISVLSELGVGMLRNVSSNTVIVASAALRIVLIVYATWQDSHASVRYTDIDYDVFTDAANFLRQGLSR